MALYGAIRSAGEYAIGSSDPPAVVKVAEQTIAALIDGLRDDRSGLDGLLGC